MDMRRHLQRLLNNTELQRMGGSFVGTVADVVEEMTKNRYKGWREELNPMIVFSDGWRLVPNQGIRRTLIDALGPETDAWKGQQLRVFRQKMERTDPKTGGLKVRWVMTVESLDP